MKKIDKLSTVFAILLLTASIIVIWRMYNTHLENKRIKQRVEHNKLKNGTIKNWR